MIMTIKQTQTQTGKQNLKKTTKNGENATQTGSLTKVRMMKVIRVENLKVI